MRGRQRGLFPSEMVEGTEGEREGAVDWWKQRAWQARQDINASKHGCDSEK